MKMNNYSCDYLKKKNSYLSKFVQDKMWDNKHTFMFSEALQKFENEGNTAWVTAIRLVPFQHLLDTEIIF